MKIGFFGGAFNPPTYAHLNIAKEAIAKMKLDQVFFVPMGNTYKKEGLIDEKNRYEMLKILCKENFKLKVSDIELNKNKEMNVEQAFEMISKEFKKENCELFFIIGADNLKKILKFEKLKSTDYNYIIVNRNNIKIEGNFKNFHVINIEENFKDISSTKVRNLIKENKMEQLNKYIPQDIIEYINKNSCY